MSNNVIFKANEIVQNYINQDKYKKISGYIIYHEDLGVYQGWSCSDNWMNKDSFGGGIILYDSFETADNKIKKGFDCRLIEDKDVEKLFYGLKIIPVCLNLRKEVAEKISEDIKNYNYDQHLVFMDDVSFVIDMGQFFMDKLLGGMNEI